MKFLKRMISGKKIKPIKLSEAIPVLIESVPAHRQNSRSTGGHYRRAINMVIKMFGDIQTDQVTAEMMESFYKHHKSRLDPQTGQKLDDQTVVTYWYMVSGAFEKLIQLGHMEANPCQYKIDKPQKKIKQRKKISRDDVNQILSMVDNARDEAVIRIFFDSGARLNEVRLMKLSTTVFYQVRDGELVPHPLDFPLHDGVELAGISTITIPKRKPGYVKFRHDACLALLDAIQDRPEVITAGHEDYIFISRTKRVMSATALHAMLKKWGNAAGVKVSNSRAYRYGFAKRMRKANVPLQKASTAMNHSNVAVTADIYQQISEEEEILTEFVEMGDI